MNYKYKIPLLHAYHNLIATLKIKHHPFIPIHHLLNGRLPQHIIKLNVQHIKFPHHKQKLT